MKFRHTYEFVIGDIKHLVILYTNYEFLIIRLLVPI